jgi:hypothetical protein
VDRQPSDAWGQNPDVDTRQIDLMSTAHSKNSQKCTKKSSNPQVAK